MRYGVRTALVCLIAACSLTAQAFALEPPTAMEVARYRVDGTLEARTEAAKALGNHKLDPAQLRSASDRLRAANGAYTLPAPPPAWQGGLPTTGTRKALAICIDFSDYPAYNTTATILSGLSGVQRTSSPLYPYESLRAYYQRSSYNKLNLQTDLLGWYRSSTPRSAMPTTPAARENLVAEALTYYDARGTDFSQYDTDANGKIDYLIVLWAGPDDGWGNFWWGYQTSWYATPLTLDGKEIGKYSWQWEGRPVNTAFDPKIVIHETGHALGLPDYYDYDDAVGPKGGVGDYDMMDASIGDHNAFSKWMLDWLTPSAVTTAAIPATLRATGTSPDALVVMRDASSTNPFSEFFVVQNRQSVANDKGFVPYSPTWFGLNVWHVDATLSGGDFAYDNSYTGHKLLSMEQADGLGEIEEGKQVNAGDFWPTTKSFGPTTSPSSARYSGADSGVTLDTISFQGAVATLRAFIQGAVDLIAPVTTDNIPAVAWHRTDVPVTFLATDAESGVAYTQYDLDGAGWSVGSTMTIPGPADGSNDGTHYLKYRSADQSGNVEATRTVSLKMDCTAPKTTVGLPVHTTTSVSMELRPTDALSGVSGTFWRVDGGTWKTGTAVVVSAGATRTVEYYSKDVAGNYESIQSFKAGANSGVYITAPASLATDFERGTLTGSVKYDGVPVAGGLVVLESSPTKTTWTRTGASARTSSSGSFSLSVAPKTTCYYRVIYIGADGAKWVGPVTTVTCRAYLTAPYVPTAVRHGRAFPTSGIIKDKHPAGTAVVRFHCYRYESGAWVLRKTASGVASDYSTTASDYSTNLNLPSSGRWRVRVYHSDAGHLPTYSAYRYFYVN